MIRRLRRALFAKQLEALHLQKLTYNLQQLGFPRPIFPDGSAANAGLLYTLLKVLWQAQPGHILELGSGLTTELIHHYLSKHAHARAISLEDDLFWHQHVAPHLTLERHCYLHRPCTGDPAFYDMSGITGPFDLVLVDGPVGDRRGALAAIPPLLAENFILIVDDAHKPDNRSGSRFGQDLVRAIAAPTQWAIVSGAKDQMLITSSQRRWLLGRAGDCPAGAVIRREAREALALRSETPMMASGGPARWAER